MATQSWAMTNRKGEAHLHLQQSIETVANELIRVAYVTASSLQKLAQDGENYKKFVERALTNRTKGMEMFVSNVLEQKWQEW
eukprot:1861152-Prorocentrum_lima.AAC.1